MPAGPYASSRDYGNARHVGLTLVPGMPSSTRPDEAIRRASRQAGLPFVNVTEAFVLDGHLTRAGHEVLASLLDPIVAARLLELNHAR